MSMYEEGVPGRRTHIAYCFHCGMESLLKYSSDNSFVDHRIEDCVEYLKTCLDSLLERVQDLESRGRNTLNV